MFADPRYEGKIHMKYEPKMKGEERVFGKFQNGLYMELLQVFSLFRRSWINLSPFYPKMKKIKNKNIFFDIFRLKFQMVARH